MVKLLLLVVAASIATALAFTGLPAKSLGISSLYQRGSRRFGVSTQLRYSNYTLFDPTIIAPFGYNTRRRNQLKKELAVAAIDNYDIEAYNSGMTTIAEDLMKKLEPLRPWSRPAHHPDLNARWSFVFTGVPTIGMKLITLLSRISVGFPPVDFRDVFLEVSDGQSRVKAIVSCNFFGLPLELNVFTSLRPDMTCPHGTMLIEQFEGIKLGGYDIPTPESWHNARTLEISYLDEDMMIARTGGGEPHFLLRHSPCSTDDSTCDIDNELTAFFQEARAKYGDKIARCLVDRAYGEECEESSDSLPVLNLFPFNVGSIIGGKDQ